MESALVLFDGSENTSASQSQPSASSMVSDVSRPVERPLEAKDWTETLQFERRLLVKHLLVRGFKLWGGLAFPPEKARVVHESVLCDERLCLVGVWSNPDLTLDCGWGLLLRTTDLEPMLQNMLDTSSWSQKAHGVHFFFVDERTEEDVKKCRKWMHHRFDFMYD